MKFQITGEFGKPYGTKILIDDVELKGVRLIRFSHHAGEKAYAQVDQFEYDEKGNVVLINERTGKPLTPEEQNAFEAQELYATLELEPSSGQMQQRIILGPKVRTDHYE